ncbi:MAG: single-stranded-DNA-specific exonuclease RecJ [Alkalispirochaeta sp.]|jgi:single-stranded-DNA-specific exonuclease
MKWHKPPVDAAEVKRISRRYGTDLLTSSILVRRNVTAAAALPYYLENDLQYLHDPFLFPDMVDVVERIDQARRENEKVLIFGDRDVDGITSTAVMVSTLRSLGLDPEWQVPEGDASYGLTVETVEDFAARSGTLIITVDCGITSVDEIARAVDLGIDTIVVDHHNPHEVLPPAVAIINPKVGDDYPFDGLCACAVCGKVRQALAVGSTEIFGELTTLLNVRPANQTVIVDAVMLEHGVEVDRVTEALVPGVARFETSRLQDFLVGRKLICYDEPLQKKLLREGLGSNVDIYMLDLAGYVGEHFPQLTGKSLLEMREGARITKYSETTEEIDVLLALYQSVVARQFPQIRESLESVSDLVALASIADMMPIIDENRTLVRRGLERLNSNPHPGLAALITEAGYTGRNLVSRDIGWTIAPLINATGRMGTPSLAVQLLLSDDEQERKVLAAEIKQLNQERRRVGDSAWKAVHPQVDSSLERNGNKLIAIHEPTVHRGVTGIIAGRLSKRYNLPAAVLTTVDDIAIGSVRSARGFMATDFLGNFEDILEQWGGHNEAAGFNLSVDRLDRFWERLSTVALSISLGDEAEEEIEIDAELPSKYLTPELESIVNRFEPYGQSNPALRFLARKMVVEDLQIMGKEQDHLRLLLSGGGYKWPAVYWGAADKVKTEVDLRDRVDVVFEFTKNFYNGNETVQLIIVDLCRSEEQIVGTE